MEKHHEITSDLTASRRQGGLMEFEKTGIYPDYLYFHSAKYKKSWRHKVKETPLTGKLVKDRKVVYEYKLTDHLVQARQPGDTKWYNLDCMFIMLD